VVGASDDHIHPDDQAQAVELYHAAARGDADMSPVEIRLRGLDGEWHTLTVAAENLLHEPAVHGVAFYATDTRRAREAEELQQLEGARLRTLIASLGVGILLQDAEQCVVLVNDAFSRMFDAGDGDGSGPRHQPDRFLDPGAGRARIAELVAAGVAERGEEVSFADGRVAERDYLPIELDGAPLGQLWVYRDVTEQALIRHRLEEGNRALAELAALKTEFIATASHELRTPLTSIVAFTQMLADGPDDDPDERREVISAIGRNADRMIQLVDELILLARFEAGTVPLTMSSVDLTGLVSASLDDWQPAAKRAGVVIEQTIEPGPALHGDAQRLRQLVDTLVASAVAATPPGGHVDVHARFTDPAWIVELTHSSRTGSSGEQLFSNANHHDDPHAAHSNALALLLGRAIVTRHGGQLSSPRTGGGTAFVVQLPLASPPAEPDSIEAPASA
jgi:signal transduction histidine kinase